MAPSRYRATGPITRNNQPTSRRPAILKSTRSLGALHKDLEASRTENQIEVELGLDFNNERYIQSIEELLPEKEQIIGKSATPAILSSLEISPTTPGTLIKVERVSDSVDDMYDVSPRGYVYKAADVGRRQTSRSTAQLTTPGSSPERKRELPNAVAGATFLKSELIHEGDERQILFETSCTPPASSPEAYSFSKRHVSKALAAMSQRPPSRGFQARANKKDGRENPSRREGHLHSTILPARPTLVRHKVLESGAVSDYVFSAKISKPQKNCTKPAAFEFLSGKLLMEYPPILPPPKVRLSTSKTTTPTPDPMRIVPTIPSTSPKERPRTRENTTKCMARCTSMCAKCTPKLMLEKCGIELLEKHPGASRLKSASACPSSVSSFGPGDDIPPSGKMHYEAGRAIMDSARTFASNRMSEGSPSLKYNDLLARLGIHHDAPEYKKDVNGIYEDFEDSLPQNDPSRVIFGKAGKNATDHGQTDFSLTPQRSCSIEEDGRKGDKRLQKIPSRSLRSFSAAHDLSKKSENQGQEASPRNEDNSDNEPFRNSLDNENEDTDEESGSEYEERALPKASVQAPVRMKSRCQSAKRMREVKYDWPTFSDDEDMAAEDDIIEIDRDIFALSENRREKRHKSSSEELNRNSVLPSPAPKQEPVEGNENISSSVEDFVNVETGSKDDADNAEQEKTPCDYYMNTYWEHGRASDGHRARDGFTSYGDFKEYCRKNKQPTDDRCILTYKKDLKHYLRCEHHASLRQDLHRVAWNFEHNPGFSFKSSSRDEETRRIQNEAIGNGPSPSSSGKGLATVADGQVAEIIAEVLKVIGSSHTADLAQLTKSKKKLESEVKGLRTRLARIQKR